MDNIILYLIGHAGVGKLTVAKAWSALTGATLVDNHLINNVVFRVIGADGKTPLPEATWDLIERVREVAFEAIETLARPELSFVFTNALKDTPGDRAWFERVVLLARRRTALFVPVIVTCDEVENLRRIPMPERLANMKHIDVDSARDVLRTQRLLPIDHPNLLRLDTTVATPEQSAELILRHARSLR